jgi:hypothetical protein
MTKNMKIAFTLFLTSLTFSAISQQINRLDIPSNSFETAYHKSNPTLKYSYDNISQTHNYSGNWDFDKDGIKDGLYFVGMGGAHLYYYLKVILSSNRKAKEIKFIQSDFPFLTTNDHVNMEQAALGFVVANIGKDLTPTIIVRLDNSTFYANKKELMKNKIKTKKIAISFKNGETKYDSL